ncbi:30S ribosomal protein S6e [Saccharolobus solfataricus]|uniref:Small ribosomal subunit protein eS6 n=3 Tax=Saccharolobus solfataricus TaxID=2287 RepID=RS6E_SACS2|nr:30S ribosomal protein S6e [Saccharolobus solfataricus]Q980A6.1 RecName: Full=Small ribosomal subunit protein eS6; AltName: Full=30S ribosomal protein S6e [Saccharolobus solfataricus P2]AAK40739.1 SSU ribosomal protein S6E (rps6E) [Saccharolobus solfataricus P2]AKA73716.1 30S ribosomal protein S6e [Saccharolobus solfataricus]AKA76413.1 30S ribosomal protein S6e [Saccharolobus solfataricus]AKA79106.1 30S ribosomal protein S6e [Saccharolobus solfataricus]AZF68187.1 30S ribosomal protein S6e [
MPDFKIVISDPQSVEPKRIKVKVKASDQVKSITGEKDGKAVPQAKVNEKTKQLLNVDTLLTLEITKQEGDKKVKVKGHFKVDVDNSVPDNEVWISKTMAEKFGAEDFEAFAYRTKTLQISVDQNKATNLVGLKIGDVFEANQLIGLPVKLKITGGSDNSGFPMRFDVIGAAKRKILLSGPPGFYPNENGERRRKTIRGNTISQEIVQINTIIVR